MAEKFTAKSEGVIMAPAHEVWQALTDPVMVKQWLYGTDMSVTEWKIGGEIRYKGEWEGKKYEDKGTILEIEPEKLLVSTYWSSMSGTPDVPESYQKVSYKLDPSGGGTKLTITQEGNATEESAKHSEGNWNQVLQSLKKIVEK
ncbi:MAG: SRPBCC family protein [Candidatus Doudnabacteria bacterium]